MRRLLLVLAAVLVGNIAWAEGCLWQAPFEDVKTWTTRVYGPLKLQVSNDTMIVTGTATGNVDTAWLARTEKIACAYKGRYAICCTLKTMGIYRNSVGCTQAHDSAVVWYDAAGVMCARAPLPFVFVDGDAMHYRYVFEVPERAVAFQVKLGWDSPNVWGKQKVEVSEFSLEKVPADTPLGGLRPDVEVPRVRIVSPSPTRAYADPVVVSVCDKSGVDVTSFAVKADGVLRKDFVVSKMDQGYVLMLPPGERPWKEGLHKLEITAADTLSHTNRAVKFFLIGDSPKTPPVTLREDGMTLIGGMPFFPIGIYAVSKRDFNAYDYNRAMADLKTAGFNMIHSYSVSRNPEFLAAASRYGMKMWTAAYAPDADVVNRLRHDSSIIAWYLGDDTKSWVTPEQAYDRDDNIYAVDPTRLTTQADVISIYNTPDSYWDYVPCTDNFLPEIYPVRGTDQKKDRTCVAETIKEMKCIVADQKADPSKRRHSVWPIIQYFKGWGWKRFPTKEELYGMSFAAIIHGAQGITWYTYGGFANEQKKTFNYGVTSSEVVWCNTTNLTHRLAALVPVLITRTPEIQPPPPQLLEGPQYDALGGPSVTVLLKEKDNVKYLLAVNASDATVTAKMQFSQGSLTRPIDVLWEKRTCKCSDDGSFTDVFKPLAVHVYRLMPSP